MELTEADATTVTISRQGGILLDSAEHAAVALVFIRAMAGLSQRAAATSSGYRQAQIGDWETLVRRPGIVTLIDYVGALGYDVMLVPRP